MVDKSGGDALQANQGAQGNMSSQDLNSIAGAGAGILEGVGGDAASMGAASQAIQQAQNQSNTANTGDGGDDNISADTNINIS